MTTFFLALMRGASLVTAPDDFCLELPAVQCSPV